MSKEFKQIKAKSETRYVLETASSAAVTSTGNIATNTASIGKVQKRSDNILAQEADTVKVPVKQKPRQGVLKTQTGAGAHRDKKKEQKQGKAKHKKPFMEELQGRLAELKNQLEAYGRYGSRNPDMMSPGDYDRYQQDQMDADRRAFKYAELQHELGHEEEPKYRSTRRSYYNAPKSKGMYFYNVPPGKENDAKAAGLRQSKSGKWYDTTENQWAEKYFGKGRYWEPKNEEQEGVEEGAEFGSNYAEQLAQEVFDHNPNLDNEDEVLNLGYNMAKGELGSRAQGIFRDEDFPSDFVSAYFFLKKNQGVSEVAPPGWEKTVKAMKKHKEIDNPYALAHYMKNKGYKSHKKESTDPYFESLKSKVEELVKK